MRPTVRPYAGLQRLAKRMGTAAPPEGVDVLVSPCYVGRRAAQKSSGTEKA